MLRKGIAGAVSLAIAAVANAAPDYRAVSLGEGLSVTPSLDVEQSYDDNIFSTDGDEEDSLVLSVRPGARFVGTNGTASLALSVAGDAGWYFDSDDDNYTDYITRVDFGVKGSRAALELYGWNESEHDARGTGVSNGFGDLTTVAFDEPAEYELDMLGAKVSFGSEQTRFRVQGGVSRFTKEYQNFRALTRDRDRETYESNASVDFAVAPKTRMFVEGAWSEIQYDLVPASGNSLDSDESRYYVGVEWRATAATTGRAKIGQVDKEFDSTARRDLDDTSWEAGIAWSPRSYTKFDFSTFRGPRETDNTGDAVDVGYYKVTWSHAWSGMTTTDVSYQYTSEEYEGATRDDDFSAFSAGVMHDWRRNVTVGAGWRFSTRDSNQVATDFDRNVVYVLLNVGL
jgi:hypothetical protein